MFAQKPINEFDFIFYCKEILFTNEIKLKSIYHIIAFEKTKEDPEVMIKKNK